MEKKLAAQYLAFRHQIPTSRTRNRRQNKTDDCEVTFDELPSTYENWRAKGNDGSSHKNENEEESKVNENAQNYKKLVKPKMFFNKHNLSLKK